MSVRDVQLAVNNVLPLIRSARGRSRWNDWPEDRTREELIDPVIRALGWTDEAHLVREHQVARHVNDAVDYAMFTDNLEPTIIVEAKRLGLDTDEWKRPFQLGYYVGLGSGKNLHAVLTNGQVWEICEVGDQGSASEGHDTVDLLDCEYTVEEQARILYDNLSRVKHQRLCNRGGGMQKPQRFHRG